MVATVPLSDLSTVDLQAEFILPAPELRRFVSGYHFYGAGPRDAPALEEWFFPSWANIRFHRVAGPWFISNTTGEAEQQRVPQAALFGPTRGGKRSVSNGGQVFGAGLSPLGWSRFFAMSAQRFADRIVPLAAAWPLGGALERRIAEVTTMQQAADVFDAFLLENLGPPSKDEALVEQLYDMLLSDHDVDLEATATRFGCSTATLRRIARQHFGFAPKLLLRRSRFAASFMAIFNKPQGEWSQLIDARYFDHSHFLRDAQDFLGESPRAFFARPRALTGLSHKHRAAMLGAPVQALQPREKSARADSYNT